MAVGVLYISYDGIMEPIGASQVWQYVRGLAQNYEITLLTYEKAQDLKDKDRFFRAQTEAKKTGITWIPLKYHKRFSFLATLYDITVGIFFSAYLCCSRGIKIVHARSYIAACVAMPLKTILRKKFIFDMRGFWADERLEIGQFTENSIIYKIMKRLEKAFFLNADCVISLTKSGWDEIKKLKYMKNKNTPIFVIPTCTDLNLFKPETRAISGDKKEFTIVVAGNVQTLYLFDDMLDFFNCLRKKMPSVKFLFLNRGQHDYIIKKLKANGIPEEKASIKEVPHESMPSLMASAGAGLFFIKPTFSKKASAPTKLGEFLACGIPCVTNSGIGDTEGIIESNNAGVVLERFDRPAKEAAAKRLLALIEDKGLKDRCRSAAEKNFSLEKAILTLISIYANLAR